MSPSEWNNCERSCKHSSNIYQTSYKCLCTVPVQVACHIGRRPIVIWSADLAQTSINSVKLKWNWLLSFEICQLACNSTPLPPIFTHIIWPLLCELPVSTETAIKTANKLSSCPLCVSSLVIGFSSKATTLVGDRPYIEAAVISYLMGVQQLNS